MDIDHRLSVHYLTQLVILGLVDLSFDLSHLAIIKSRGSEILTLFGWNRNKRCDMHLHDHSHDLESIQERC